eukprot:COSAG06_NODE_29378_length_557_cov_3.220524_1_plen_40_part_01
MAPLGLSAALAALALAAVADERAADAVPGLVPACSGARPP